jgi:integrase
VRPFVATLAKLPMRCGEVAALKVGMVKLRERCLEIPTGKTEPRIIPLGGSMLAHFQACAKDKLPTAWLHSRADGGAGGMQEALAGDAKRRDEVRAVAVHVKPGRKVRQSSMARDPVF